MKKINPKGWDSLIEKITRRINYKTKKGSLKERRGGWNHRYKYPRQKDIHREYSPTEKEKMDSLKSNAGVFIFNSKKDNSESIVPEGKLNVVYGKDGKMECANFESKRCVNPLCNGKTSLEFPPDFFIPNVLDPFDEDDEDDEENYSDRDLMSMEEVDYSERHRKRVFRNPAHIKMFSHLHKGFLQDFLPQELRDEFILTPVGQEFKIHSQSLAFRNSKGKIVTRKTA